MSNPIVEVSEGKLKGAIRKTVGFKTYYAFKGIPYALPPVGERRFSCPIQPEVWEGVRDATQDCNICAQYDDSGSVVGDEDCLFLNVYTPKIPPVDQLLPVIVFFHGGGFVHGNGTDDNVHGPDYFMNKDVVMVTINYRLGVLGFLCLNTKEAPGNMGMRDQVLALKWVKNNISEFGGDQNNVTIYGVSAGAASVEYLLLSPSAKGLFHKAIGQAGSSLLPWARNENIKQLAFKIPQMKGNNITDTEGLYKYLKGLTTKDLIEASMAAIMTEKWKGGLYFGFVPTTEKPGSWKPFLSVPPEIILKSGNYSKVPYLTGTCSREGMIMTAFNTNTIEDLARKKNFIDYLPFQFSDEEKADVENKLKTVYSEGASEYNGLVDPVIEFFSDVDFIGGVHYAALEMAKSNPNVYFYFFSYDGGLNYLKNKRNLQHPGACHGDEGGYLIKSNTPTKNITETDLMVRDRMVTMWTNFAKFGNPTPQTDNIITTKWEPMSATKSCYLQIDDKLTMKTDLLPQRMKLFEHFYKAHSEKVQEQFGKGPGN